MDEALKSRFPMLDEWEIESLVECGQCPKCHQFSTVQRTILWVHTGACRYSTAALHCNCGAFCTRVVFDEVHAKGPEACKLAGPIDFEGDMKWKSQD